MQKRKVKALFRSTFGRIRDNIFFGEERQLKKVISRARNLTVL